MIDDSLDIIAQRWSEYGPEYAAYPSLWDSSLALATLGPQTTSEGTTARDYSSRKNHGTLTGATHLPTWSNQSYRGAGFRALAFDGAEDYVSVPNETFFDFDDANACTISCFLKTTYSSATSVTILSKLYANLLSGRLNGWELAMVSGKLRFQWLYSDGLVGYRIDTSATVNDGLWRHVVARKLPGAGYAYLDFFLGGVQDGESNQVDASPSGSKLNNISVQIGRRANGTTPLPGSLSTISVHGRGLTPAEISILARHPLAAYECRPLPRVFRPGVAAVSLTVQNSAVVVSSQLASLTQHNAIVVGNSQSVVTSGNAALTQHNTLTVGNSSCPVTSTAPALTQHNALAVGNSAVAVTSGAVSLTQHNALTIGNSACVVSSDAAALVQHGALTVASSQCAATSDAVALTQHATLAVGNAAVAVTSGQAALTQHAALTVGNASCAVTSVAPALTQHGALIVQNSAIAVTSTAVDLTQHAALAVQDSTCVVSSSSPALTQYGAVVVQSSACVVSSENVALTAHTPGVLTLTVQGSLCVVSSTSPALTQHSALTIAGSQILISSGNVVLSTGSAGVAVIVAHQSLLLAI